jgi:type III pantothenate kinase
VLLACDVGNSNIVVGLYDDARLAASWRLTSRLNATVDEYGVMLGSLLSSSVATSARRPGPVGEQSSPGQSYGAKWSPEQVTGAILSSVVPPLTPKLTHVIEKLCRVTPLVVGPGVKTGLDIQYEDPREVGADRIVNAVGALSRQAAPQVIVDSRTATTFDVILPPNIYAGGIIVPGLYISLDALVTRTAKLPKVELRPTDKVVGRNTADSIRSGLYHGTGALVDGLVARIAAEHLIDPLVIATGGAGEMLQSASSCIDAIEPDLTLHGLREIWLRNQ